jgi:Cdc6-like AAA superfamily ATPase
MFRIASRLYKSNRAGIAYLLSNDLSPASDKHIWFIEGQNGIGKTLFVEEVIIPILKNDAVPFFFVGQDFEVQSLTLRASIAILNLSKAKELDFDLVAQTADQLPNESVFMLDEFDKRCTQESFFQLLMHKNSKHALIVSHHDNWLKNESRTNFKTASILRIDKSSNGTERVISEERIY